MLFNMVMGYGVSDPVTPADVPVTDSFSPTIMFSVMVGMFVSVFLLNRGIERLLKAVDAHRVEKYLVRHRAPGTVREWSLADKVFAYRQKGIPAPSKILSEYRRTAAGSTDDVFDEHPPPD
jgi:hypothetical protein